MSSEIIQNLEKKLNSYNIFGRLLAAWGLSLAYRDMGDQAKETAMQTYLRKTAPYCKPLLFDTLSKQVAGPSLKTV
jgi:hypothetical protein